MVWIVLFPVRLLLAVCLYAIGLCFMLTIVGIPIGLTCFSLARELTVVR